MTNNPPTYTCRECNDILTPLVNWSKSYAHCHNNICVNCTVARDAAREVARTAIRRQRRIDAGWIPPESRVVEPRPVVVVEPKPEKVMKIKVPKVPKEPKEPKPLSKTAIAKAEQSARKSAAKKATAYNQAQALKIFNEMKAAEALLPPIHLVTMEETIAKMDIWREEDRLARVGQPPPVIVDYSAMLAAKSAEYQRTHYWRDTHNVRHPPTDPAFRTPEQDKIK